MKVSARNVFEGSVKSIHIGAVNAEVEVVTRHGDSLIAIVTMSSVKGLGLASGSSVTALVKAPWVMLSTQDSGLRFSARNQLRGKITELHAGAVNTEVGLTLEGGTVVYSIITNDAVSDMGLKLGGGAVAIIKASHVILAVPA